MNAAPMNVRTWKAIQRRICYLAVGLLCLWACGCSPPTIQGVTATGTVSAEDAPLSGAFITLEPMGNTTGPNATAPIFNGQFVFAEDAGLAGGKYRIRFAMIPAEIRRSIPADQMTSMPPDDAVIAPAYDTNSKLSCELKPGQENSLSYEVEFLKSTKKSRKR